MPLPFIAAILPTVSLFIYAILTSIEAGAALFVVEPELLALGAGAAHAARNYLSPLWEATNIFLVLPIIGVALLFPGATPVWTPPLLGTLFLFLALVGIRILGILYFSYGTGESRIMRALFVAGSFCAPIVLTAGVIPYLMTGITPFGSVEWILAGTFGIGTFVTALFISFSFFEYFAKRQGLAMNPRLPAVTRIFFVLFLLVAAFAFVIMSTLSAPVGSDLVKFLPGFVLAAMIEILLFERMRARTAGYRFALAVVMFGLVTAALVNAQLPYLVFPMVTVFSTFTDPASGGLIIDALAGGMILVVPSFVLLYYLFAFRRQR
ncbi:MAG TPA: cytochrome d ubiquinol oxidase subunit II [Candidatus Paceibacterota bacterium]|nr:cytochrome d ubiquinol oxidase subunit II [Candidatus Paceibacterota bacterium]